MTGIKNGETGVKGPDGRSCSEAGLTTILTKFLFHSFLSGYFDNKIALYLV